VKLFTKVILMMFVLSFSLNVLAENDPDKSGNNDYNINLKKKSDYKKAKKQFDMSIGKPVDFYIDFQLGVGSTSPHITTTDGSALTEKAKLGYTVGGLIYINLFDAFSLTTGVSFDGKSFGVQQPTTTLSTSTDSLSTAYVPANYFVVPLFVDLGGMVSEKVGLWFTGGPYFGFLMSKPSNTYSNLGYKNFDLGLNATLTANYVIMYPFSIIFGTTFKYGGLNNLISTPDIQKVTTTNFTFFSGLRFSL
jgi:hypothetical protein